MSRQPLRLTRGTRAQIAAYTGGSGEPVFNAEDKTIHIQDGVTPGGVPLARQDKVVANDNLPNVEFPIRDGGTHRNLVRRLGANFVRVADQPRGTEGSPAADNAAIASALSAAGSGSLYSRRTVILDEGDDLGGGPNCRFWRTTGQHDITQGTTLYGGAKDLKVIPVNPQAGSSVWNITGGQTEIGFLYGVQDNPYANFDFIQVCKPTDSLPVFMHDMRVERFRTYCRWFDGDQMNHQNITGINNVMMIDVRNNGLNGSVLNLTSQGGGGIRYDYTDEKLHPLGIGKVGVEGNSHIQVCCMSVRQIGEDGNPCPPPLTLNAGTFLTFLRCVFSGVQQGIAVVLDGSKIPVTKNAFYDCDILGERNVSNMVGVQATGATGRIRFMAGTIQGFTGQGVVIAGNPADPARSPSDFLFDGVNFSGNGASGDPTRGDMFFANVPGVVTLNNNFFNSADDTNSVNVSNHGADNTGNPNTTVYAINTRVHGSGNSWWLPPSISGGLFNFHQNYGRTPVVGIPGFASSAAALAAGLPTGWEFFEPSTGALRRVGIGL